jgi:dTDP-4-dehydrorhamnose reductase
MRLNLQHYSSDRQVEEVAERSEQPGPMILEDAERYPLMTERGRLLVTGASGQLGYHLCRYLVAEGYEVDGTYNSRRPALPAVRLLECNFENPAHLARLGENDYRAVIHTAALTSPDECERKPDLTRRVNVIGTEALLKIFPASARFIYISTDLVFDGTKGRYRETEPINPVNVYARSKAAAERGVRKRRGGVVVRMALMYGPETPFPGGFLAWMKRRLEKGEEVPLYTDQYRTPIYAGDMVRALRLLIERPARHRLYHLGGAQRLTRWEFGTLYAEIFGWDRTLLRPVSCETAGVVRGRDCSLDCRRFLREFGFRPEGVAGGLARLKQGIY